ncbi:uncharacterized protein OCT59_012051 [Rhizophagus irregularis]|uniref:uncharacterized protein n=1 Tax=Rhizophagus irregularis TaxID=588596 RepID=UPI003325382F|nr:hypothetical protein OCT59_012051 [Rhizophagus irregularis]
MSGYGKKCCTINNIYPTKEESRGPLNIFINSRKQLCKNASLFRVLSPPNLHARGTFGTLTNTGAGTKELILLVVIPYCIYNGICNSLIM